MTAVPVPCAIDAAARSMRHASLLVLRDLQRGVSSLGAIARLAPLLGAFSSTLTCLWWLNLPPNWCSYGDCAGGLSESFVPLLLSLPIAVFAHALNYCLAAWLATFNFEVQTAALETLGHLARYRAALPLPPLP